MIHFDQLVPDIIYIITNQLDFVGQKNFRTISTNYIKYPITNLSTNVPNREKITDSILKLYPYITKLNVTDNENVTNINHLIYLRKLNASGACRINNSGIIDLTNLTKLNISYNEKITDIDHLINLQILHAGGKHCRISNASFSSLTNLTEVDAGENYNINVDYTDKNLELILMRNYASDYEPALSLK